MSNNPYRQDREELRELLQQYANLKAGRHHSFIEEDGFERIIDYFDEREQYQAALEAAIAGIDQFPYSANLLIRKADLLITLRHYQEALDVLEQAELFDSSDTDIYILKTDAYLALDRQEEAARLLEDAIRNVEGEEKIDLLFELADVYDDYENFERLFDCLKEILEQDPNNEEALYKICFWTDFTGRNEESIRIHQRIIDEYPFNELAWFNLGAAYQGLKLYEKSIDAYQYAVAIDEKFDYAYRNMGDAFIRLRKYKDAIEMLEKVVELNRPEPVIYEAIGHCYDKIGQFAQARFYYKKASHLNPDDSQMYYKIACTYMNEGSWNPAVKSLETALRIHIMQPEYNLALGRCYMEMGKIDEAITYLGNVIRIRPRHLTGWTEFLRCLYAADMMEEGLEYAFMAFEHTDGKPLFLYFIALFMLENAQSKEAMMYLDKAMEVNPKLIKTIIEINPSLLQNQQVVEVIARHKKKKTKK